MNNFGVIELASTKTTNAPGWAYVPDTTPNLASVASLQTRNRKRAARNQAANASTSALYADADARQEAKLRREIEALDRDNYHRDVSIPIPVSTRKDNKGVKKHTPNVRKILQSQKTLANHLDDFEALGAQERVQNAPASGTAATSLSERRPSNARNRALEKKEQQQQQQQKNKKKATSRSGSVSKATTAVKQEEDVEMIDASPENEQEQENNDSSKSAILTPYSRPGYPPSHPLDGNPLLASRVPPLPTDAELQALLKAPPLSYVEARGRWTDDDRRYPARVFCEVCGYWGRVRCMKCGVRVCALDCLETHREECVTRYGL
ncbi:hypothetical protein F4819DRAFT_432165 [Hypoxylon fuscum]|nr:hypothetical protein F4819DRAFT_432165 [Hypoxylon fuscum]